MTSHLEIERKYDIDPGAEVPGLQGPLPGPAEPGEPATYTLVARYFDTEDLRLAARGITLRRRDDGWCLELPVGAGVRHELREPAGPNVPDRLAVLVAAHTRGRALVHVATLEARRTVLPLYGADGELLAEVADDEVTGRPVNGHEQRWREIEVELAAGPPELLEAVDQWLLAAGARPGATGSRLGRLLATGGPRPREYRTAGDVIVSYVAEQREVILAYDPRVRRAEYDAVHKMRVAVRRTRSILRAAARLLDAERAPWLEGELKWLAGELGEVRDLEVLRERFAGRLAEIGAEPPPWLAELHTRERAAYVRLDRTLLGDRYFALLDALDAFVADPPFGERASRTAHAAVPALVARAWRRVTHWHAELEDAELRQGGDLDEARHRTRKAAKRARYTAEAARPVLGEPARRLAAQAERVQETLGAYQDSVIARERLAELATGDTSGEGARTLGALMDVERAAADRALNDAREVWREAADPAHVRALSP